MKLVYSYLVQQITKYPENATRLTPLERLLLDEVDELTYRYENLLESVPVIHTI